WRSDRNGGVVAALEQAQFERRAGNPGHRGDGHRYRRPLRCQARRHRLIAAIVMGVALANLPGIDLPEDRRFFKTVVQMVIGLLFISISATVTTTSVRTVLAPTLALIAGLVLLVRPLVAAAATLRTALSI